MINITAGCKIRGGAIEITVRGIDIGAGDTGFVRLSCEEIGDALIFTRVPSISSTDKSVCAT